MIHSIFKKIKGITGEYGGEKGEIGEKLLRNYDNKNQYIFYLKYIKLFPGQKNLAHI